MSQNIWIHITKIYYGLIYRSLFDLKFLLVGSKKQIGDHDYKITDEIITGGPTSFRQKPTAIKIGRAIFVPFILISQLYARNKETK